MSTFPLLCVVRSKIWQKSGFLWKAKVDGSDVRNGVKIRKGKTGRVLFWFSVQTHQQSCDKDEMMWADEWRVIRSKIKITAANICALTDYSVNPRKNRWKVLGWRPLGNCQISKMRRCKWNQPIIKTCKNRSIEYLASLIPQILVGYPYHISFFDKKGSLATTLGSQLLAVWWAPLVCEDTPASGCVRRDHRASWCFYISAIQGHFTTPIVI